MLTVHTAWWSKCISRQLFSVVYNISIYITLNLGQILTYLRVLLRSPAGKMALMEHIRCHSGEKPHACNVCGKRFRRSADVKEHAHTHDENRRRYPCSLCSKSFTQKIHLKYHLMTHTNDYRSVKSVNWNTEGMTTKCDSEYFFQNIYPGDVVNY